MDFSPELFSGSYDPTYLVAPFWDDIVTTNRGKISYKVFTGTSHTLIQRVSSFVTYKMNGTFSGNWMLVAEWRDVAEFGTTNLRVSVQFYCGTVMTLKWLYISGSCVVNLVGRPKYVHI